MTAAAEAGPAPTIAPPPLPLRTERLLLRAVRLDDEAAMGYYGDPDVARYLPLPVLDADGIHERAALLAARTAPSAPDEALAVAVEHEGVLIGDLMLRLTTRPAPDQPPSIADVGWVFAPSAGGRGLATEAARALVAMAFDHYPLHRIAAQLHPDNVRSAALCERLGMTREAHLRRDFPETDGTWGDTAIYGLLREEWEAAAAG